MANCCADVPGGSPLLAVLEVSKSDTRSAGEAEVWDKITLFGLLPQTLLFLVCDFFFLINMVLEPDSSFGFSVGILSVYVLAGFAAWVSVCFCAKNSDTCGVLWRSVLFLIVFVVPFLIEFIESFLIFFDRSSPPSSYVLAVLDLVMVVPAIFFLRKAAFKKADRAESDVSRVEGKSSCVVFVRKFVFLEQEHQQ